MRRQSGDIMPAIQGVGRYIKKTTLGRACKQALPNDEGISVSKGNGGLFVELDCFDVAVVDEHVGSLGVLYILHQELFAAFG